MVERVIYGIKEWMADEMYSENDILIYGGGGHAKSVIDLIRASGQFRIVGIVDDGMDVSSTVMDVPVLGGADQLDALFARGVHLAANAVGGIGAPEKRVAVFERLDQAGFRFPALVHPRAYVEPTARVADGSQVFAFAYVGSDSTVGFGCILNYGSITSHDCHLDDYVNLSPGATLAGGVSMGDCTQVGMRATVNLNLTVGSSVRIGNSATVKCNVPDGTIIHAGAVYPPARNPDTQGGNHV